MFAAYGDYYAENLELIGFRDGVTFAVAEQVPAAFTAKQPTGNNGTAESSDDEISTSSNIR